jgi:hypothetical protein
MRRLWQWLVIPGLTLGLAEAYVRTTVDRVPTWYRAAERIAGEEPLRALFIGSSRVQASITPRAFDEALAARGQAPGRSLNLGRGHTTDSEHYLGLRRVLAADPAHLRGVVVFAEAPGGLAGQSRWDRDGWAFEEQPGLLVEVLGLGDLPRFLRSTGLTRETRAHVALRTLLRPVALFHRRERLRQHWNAHVLPALAGGRLPEPIPQAPLGADLEGPGPGSSIRADPAAFAQARRSAQEFGVMLLRNQAPFGDWRGSIQEDIVRLVQSHGGRMVFFEVPQSDVFAQVYRTPTRLADAAAFAEQARRWGACVVRPPFATTDDDFPDLWHLHSDRSPAFSAELARAWLDTCDARSG